MCGQLAYWKKCVLDQSILPRSYQMVFLDWGNVYGFITHYKHKWKPSSSCTIESSRYSTVINLHTNCQYINWRVYRNKTELEAQSTVWACVNIIQSSLWVETVGLNKWYHWSRWYLHYHIVNTWKWVFSLVMVNNFKQKNI